MQVANYGIGGHYDAHYDIQNKDKEPDSPMIVTKDPNGIVYPTGDRMSTLMLYLSEVQRGGYTVFPHLGLYVPPVKGSAVYWHNIKRSGRSDKNMQHSGCPVVLGSKWVANKWIREIPNIFHRKCTGNIDV